MKNSDICYEIKIIGIVQGVGFRPFLYRLAHVYQLNGYVYNDQNGVLLRIEGNFEKTKKFITAIETEAPPQSQIETISVIEIPLQHYSSFQIQPNPQNVVSNNLYLSPDLNLCQDCLKELWSPENKRYFYPFINCTNCGPRFSIIEKLPYDRKETTMKDFQMCSDCLAEYYNPENRRYHAQPNACHLCGPHLNLLNQNGKIVIQDLSASDQEMINQTVNFLKAGKIIAIKGIGGFHLCCDATNENAVRTLRLRKNRPDKPLAVMFPDLQNLHQNVILTDVTESLLKSVMAPIVLCKKKTPHFLAPSIAPLQYYLGVMLPYSPLHELLLKKCAIPLVMTSGNLSSAVIISDNQQALHDLRSIADYFLLHNRKIHFANDDSVVKIFRQQPYLIRRSRGYAPQMIKVKKQFSQKILAVGAELKNTFCIADQNAAILSQHIGDLKNLATFQSFQNNLYHFQQIFNFKPDYIVHDLHPEYLNTKWVYKNYREELPKKILPVQHHHAHIAACIGENHYEGTVIGVALDGTGYGLDNTLWGGEIFIGTPKNFQRIGHLQTFILPGGERAIQHPWRIALACLLQTGIEDVQTLPFLQSIPSQEINVIQKMLCNKINCFTTSSCGRLFDAAAALIGVKNSITYEGQAAIELEQLCYSFQKENILLDNTSIFFELQKLSYFIDDQSAFSIIKKNNIESQNLLQKYIINWQPIFKGIVNDLKANESQAIMSLKFHNSLILSFAEMIKKISLECQINTVVLSGGCFLNNYLLENLTKVLENNQMHVLTHRKVPCNDGGIAFGQAIIANSQLE